MINRWISFFSVCDSHVTVITTILRMSSLSQTSNSRRHKWRFCSCRDLTIKSAWRYFFLSHLHLLSRGSWSLTVRSRKLTVDFYHLNLRWRIAISDIAVHCECSPNQSVVTYNSNRIPRRLRTLRLETTLVGELRSYL